MQKRLFVVGFSIGMMSLNPARCKAEDKVVPTEIEKSDGPHGEMLLKNTGISGKEVPTNTKAIAEAVRQSVSLTQTVCSEIARENVAKTLQSMAIFQESETRMTSQPERWFEMWGQYLLEAKLMKSGGDKDPISEKIAWGRAALTSSVTMGKAYALKVQLSGQTVQYEIPSDVILKYAEKRDHSDEALESMTSQMQISYVSKSGAVKTPLLCGSDKK